MNLYKLYQKLYQLSRKQTEVIKKGDYDQLNKLIKEKQEIIDEIDKINHKEYINQQDNPEQFFESLKQLMKKTEELENKNQETIKTAKDELVETVLDFNKKQKSRQSYFYKKGYEAKFIDKKS